MRKPNKEKRILRFVFDEMEETEASDFLSELCSNDELWDTYEEWEGAIDEIKDAEAGPSQKSVDNIMSFVTESNPKNQRNGLGGLIDRFFTGMNLHATLAAAMLVFVLVGIAGSIYKIKRSQNLSPDVKNVSHQVMPAQDPSLQWEPTHIDQGLEDVRIGIENLMKKDKL